LRARSFGQSQNRQSRRRRAQIELQPRVARFKSREPISSIFTHSRPAFYVFEHVSEHAPEHDLALASALGILQVRAVELAAFAIFNCV
jgi:hypothetical protein